MDDFTLSYAGSISILKPITPSAKNWVADYMNGAQRWCGGVVIEHHYVDDIVDAIMNDGLSIN